LLIKKGVTKLRSLRSDVRAIAAGAAVGTFIIVAIAVIVAMALTNPIFTAWNSTANTVKTYGSTIATATITLGYLVGFVFVAAIIVYIVKAVIE
jgi:hypothetical protein